MKAEKESALFELVLIFFIFVMFLYKVFDITFTGQDWIILIAILLFLLSSIRRLIKNPKEWWKEGREE